MGRSLIADGIETRALTIYYIRMSLVPVFEYAAHRIVRAVATI